MAASSEKTIRKPQLYLRSRDGVTIKSVGALEAESGFIRSHLHTNTISVAKPNGKVDLLLPLPNVDSFTLTLVTAYCCNRHRHRHHNAPPQSHLDSHFLTNHAYTREILRNLMHAAESLEIHSLFNSTRNRMEEQDSQIRNRNRILERLRRESPH